MKTPKFSLFAIPLLFLLLVACRPSISSQMNKAESIFIEEVQYMTEEEALSKEINYYKAPEISIRTHKRSLTGRDLIHECNRVMKEDEEKDYIQLGSTMFKTTRRVWDIKEFAIKHPDDIVAEEFYFVGTFTHFGKGFNTRKANVIYVSELDRYIIDQLY